MFVYHNSSCQYQDFFKARQVQRPFLRAEESCLPLERILLGNISHKAKEA